MIERFLYQCKTHLVALSAMTDVSVCVVNWSHGKNTRGQLKPSIHFQLLSLKNNCTTPSRNNSYVHGVLTPAIHRISGRYRNPTW